MGSEEDLPPVIKTMLFIAAMISYAVAGFEADREGDVSFSDLIYILNDGLIINPPHGPFLRCGLEVSPWG